jgi:GT2 family glycosyltransferase
LDSLINSIQYTIECLEVEIIVTDDSTNDKVYILCKKYNKSLVWLQGPQKGPGANRNNGYKSVNSDVEWIIFIDDDCFVNEKFIDSYFQKMKYENINVIEGQIICPDKSNTIFKRQPEYRGGGGVLPSGNFAIKSELFAKIGGFDEELKIMEDMEFAHRLKYNGHIIEYCPSAIAYHPSQTKRGIFYFHWVFHFKWQLLLNYKCRLRHIETNIIQSVFKTWIDHINIIIRQTSHLITKPDPDRWVMYCFERCLAWITMPIVLPYLSFWDVKFRNMIKKKLISLKRSPLKL